MKCTKCGSECEVCEECLYNDNIDACAFLILELRAGMKHCLYCIRENSIMCAKKGVKSK